MGDITMSVPELVSVGYRDHGVFVSHSQDLNDIIRKSDTKHIVLKPLDMAGKIINVFIK